MAVEQGVPGRLVRWISAAEPDWDAVYADQLPRVFNFFRYRFGPTADAEDLTARTFEKAWRARQRYRRDLASFATWLMSIARNVAASRAGPATPCADRGGRRRGRWRDRRRAGRAALRLRCA